MPKRVEATRPKIGRKDLTVLMTGIGICICAGMGTIGFIPLPSL